MNEWLKVISESMNPAGLGLKLSYPNLGDFLPVAIICGVSIVLTALWLLVVFEYTWSRGKHLR
jgi:hypothetical protein